MKKIVLNKLKLNNFKGIKKLEVKVNPEIQEISGDNATGKTTLFDAVTWLLFGKDSQNRTDFEIKNTVNRELNKSDHEVEGIFTINGKELNLRRVYKEKWTKPRGQAEEVFSGHVQEFYINDIPKQAGEYSQEIASLINEDLFKMITNPHYFNNMKWQDRRELLISLAGGVDDAELNTKEFAVIISELNGVSLDDFKKKIAVQKKKLNDNIETIPARIEECERQKPETIDVDAVNADLAIINERIEEKQKTLASIKESQRLKDEEILGLNAKINDNNLKIQRIEQDIKTAIQSELFKSEQESNEKANEIKRLESELSDINTNIKITTTNINAKENTLIQLRELYESESLKEFIFDKEIFTCPTCKQKLPDVDFNEKETELRENFNKNKVNILNGINQKGLILKSEISELEKDVEKYQNNINAINVKIASIKTYLHEHPVQKQTVNADEAIANNKEIIALKAENKSILSNINIIVASNVELDNLEIINEIKALTNEADQLKLKLNSQSQIESLNNRIAELSEQKRTMAQELAELEGKEFLLKQYQKSKMDLVEKKVNSMFTMCTFRMFETQINGGEKEDCTCIVNGVPYLSANNAAQINAGLDIINAICNKYQVNAPIVIDNAESVNNILSTSSQQIRLLVSKDKSLIIK